MPPDENYVSADELKRRLDRNRSRRRHLHAVLDRLKRQAKRLRRRYRRKRRREREDGPKAATAWARSKINTRENPPGSNLGPGSDGITAMQRYTGYAVPDSNGKGVFWCGCFVCWAVVKVGKALIPARIRLGFNGYIVDDARNNRNGLRAVPFDQAREGDIVTYTFPHIGYVVNRDGDYLSTIEGNTSDGASGSQNNGGGVYPRRRHRSEVACIARPDYE